LPARVDHPAWRSGDPSGNAVPAGGVIANITITEEHFGVFTQAPWTKQLSEQPIIKL
jgi:hypothetical protein